MSTHEIARRILGHLSNMVGPRSTASAPGSVVAGTKLVPSGCVLLPVRGGQLDPSMPFRTTADITLTTTPAAVALEPMIGGAATNLAEDTVLRWQDVAGVESLVLSANATGGSDRAGLSLRQMVYYESVSRQAAISMFQAKVGLLPALILVWDGSDIVANVGRARVLQRERWTIFVATSRMDGAEQRGADGLTLLDEVQRRFVQAVGYGLNLFSVKPTVMINRGRLVAAPTSFVYSLTIGTFRFVSRLDDRVLAEADHVNIDATTGGAVPFTVVDDVKVSFTEPFDEDPSP